MDGALGALLGVALLAIICVSRTCPPASRSGRGEERMSDPTDPSPSHRQPDDRIQADPPIVPSVPESLGPVAADSEPRYCLRCGRRLKPLRQFEFPRCPECRLPYDPGNLDTFR